MTRLILLTFAMISALALSGCGPLYQTKYTYTPPTTWQGRQCVNRCINHKSQCQARCRIETQQCRSNAMEAARPQYRKYVRAQKRQGKAVVMSLSDFADTNSCNDSCGCMTDYRQCYNNCGGTVNSQQVCVAFCNAS